MSNTVLNKSYVCFVLHKGIFGAYDTILASSAEIDAVGFRLKDVWLFRSDKNEYFTREHPLTNLYIYSTAIAVETKDSGIISDLISLGPKNVIQK